MQMKSCPKKDQKKIFCRWSYSDIQIVAFNLCELKYLRGMFWNICSNRPQNFGGLKGKSTKKAWLDVGFCVSCQLALQICKESETEPQS